MVTKGGGGRRGVRPSPAWPRFQIAAWTSARIRHFARGYAASSRVIAVEAVKSFSRYLCARGVLAVNPTLGLRRPPVHQRERSTLTPAEVQRLVYGTTVGALPSDPLEIRNRTMLWLMYIDGLRVGEPGKLR